MSKFALYATFDGFAVTPLRNYQSYVMDANKVLHMRKRDGFNTYSDCIEYLCTYGGYSKDSDEFLFY